MKNADTSVLVRFAYSRDAAGHSAWERRERTSREGAARVPQGRNAAGGHNPTAIERESGLGAFYCEYHIWSGAICTSAQSALCSKAGRWNLAQSEAKKPGCMRKALAFAQPRPRR